MTPEQHRNQAELLSHSEDPEARRRAGLHLRIADAIEARSRAIAGDEWKESDHPRGQPGNPGQFGSGGGGKAPSPSSGGKTEAGESGTGPGAKNSIISDLLKKGATSKDILDATGWKAINIPRVALALGLRLEKVGNVYKGVPMGPEELEGARRDAMRKARELAARKAAKAEPKPPQPPEPKPTGKGPMLTVGIQAPPEQRDRYRDFQKRVEAVANKLPDAHRAMLANIPIKVTKGPPEGADYAGLYRWSGEIEMAATFASGVKAWNEGNVMTHEAGHAIDHKYGWTLGPMVAATVDEDAQNNMLPSERARAKYWFQNNKERFAELYALAYAPKDQPTVFFGGMGRARAEKVFSKSLALITSLGIGEKGGKAGEWRETGHGGYGS